MIDNRKTGLWNLPPNIWVLTATSFLTDVSSEMIFNLVPLYLFNVLGVSTAIIGMIDGIAETTASLLKLYSGALSDKWNGFGPRAPFIFGAILALLAAGLFLSMKSSPNLSKPETT